MIDIISQVIIFVFGVSAAWLISLKSEKWRRWGYVVALVSQPFWIYVTFKQRQWGMFLLALCWTYGWAKGAYNLFDFRKKRK